MLILLFRSSTATANFLFPHFCVEGKEREGEREKDLVTDQPLSVSTFRAGCLGLDTALLHLACTLAAREREMPSLSPGQLPLRFLREPPRALCPLSRDCRL